MNHLDRPHILSKPTDHENLYIYLAVSVHAISVALLREENPIYKLLYYASKRLTGAEINYSKIENLVYFLLIALRKLRSYF